MDQARPLTWELKAVTARNKRYMRVAALARCLGAELTKLLFEDGMGRRHSRFAALSGRRIPGNVRRNSTAHDWRG
jgi:hypothetical protein